METQVLEGPPESACEATRAGALVALSTEAPSFPRCTMETMLALCRIL